MRGRIIFFGNLALGLLLLGLVLWRYGGPALEILGADPSLPLLLTFVIVVGLSITCLSWRWGYILAGLTKPPSLARLILYRSTAHSIALLIPSGKLGGDPLRIWFLIRSGTRTDAAVGSVAVDRAQEIGSTAPFSLIFAALLVQAEIPHLDRAFITVSLGSLGLLGGIYLAMRRLKKGAGLVSALLRSTRLNRLSFIRAQSEWIEKSEEAILGLTQQKRRMGISFAAGLVSNLIVVAEFALLLQAFDLPSNTTAIAAALFATGAAHLLPVPAGIGVLEGAQIWIFGMLGYPADVGMAVGLAVRLREFIWILPGGIYLLLRPI
ncbi:MAG: lysylphosphatidylglycerol synthase transmembrane domain-containing protein, partial [Myxococcota bacterium]|nr:lysylphosphatidylglycerol synthase transmembrane domain-containing protein [Myxococcota bacterium]